LVALQFEISSHLFFITLLVWIFSNLLFKKKFNQQIYWIVSILWSAISVLGMIFVLDSLGIISLNTNNSFILFLLWLLVFIEQLIILKMFKKNGFISALFVNLGCTLIMSIIWPVIFY